MKKTALPSSSNQKSLPRRDFIQQTGLGVLAAALPLPKIFAADSLTAIHPAKLSMQLYTVRNEIAKDIAGTLKRVVSLGFKHVETAFWPDGMTIQQAAKQIRDAGLSVSSSHIELPIGDKKQAFLDTAKAFGNTRMIWHGWPEDKRYSSLDGTKELAGIYNTASKFAKENGLRLGLHNHWWEYRNKVGGKFVYEVLLEELDKDIFFEVDTYWVKVAGQDPAAILKRLGSRAQLLHIKDGPAKWNDDLPKDNPDPMTAVGKGTQNFPAIAEASNGNAEWFVVEMDKTATDVFEALKESYDYLKKNKLVSA